MYDRGGGWRGGGPPRGGRGRFGPSLNRGRFHTGPRSYGRARSATRWNAPGYSEYVPWDAGEEVYEAEASPPVAPPVVQYVPAPAPVAPDVRALREATAVMQRAAARFDRRDRGQEREPRGVGREQPRSRTARGRRGEADGAAATGAVAGGTHGGADAEPPVWARRLMAEVIRLGSAGRVEDVDPVFHVESPVAIGGAAAAGGRSVAAAAAAPSPTAVATPAFEVLGVDERAEVSVGDAAAPTGGQIRRFASRTRQSAARS